MRLRSGWQKAVAPPWAGSLPGGLPSAPAQRHEVVVRYAGDIYRLALEDVVELLAPVSTRSLTPADLERVHSAYRRAKDALEDG